MSLLDAFVEDGLEESIVNAGGSKEVWFAIRTDGQKGRGTADDPYNGCDRDQFDALLKDLPENVTIRLWPGVFQTRGGYGNGNPISAWAPKSGQRLIGSGMFATTLKLVLDSSDTDVGLPPAPSRMFYAIGSNPDPDPALHLTSYEVSDLTVDCNMAGQPPTVDGQGQSIGYARVNCAGIRLIGKNLRVRRVRVINWGRRNSFQELFPLVVAGGTAQPRTYPAEDMSNVIEDCLVEQPDWNTGDQATLVSAQVIRNCFIRGDRVRPPGDPKPTLKIISLTASGTVATLTTAVPHGRVAGDWIVVSGVVKRSGDDAGTDNSLYNGTFKVKPNPGTTTLEYDLSGTPTEDDTSDAWLDRITAQSVVIPPNPATPPPSYIRKKDDDATVLEITTASPHYRAPGTWVQLAGLLPASQTNFDQNLNGYYMVLDDDFFGRLTFRCKRGNVALPDPQISYTQQVLINHHQALTGNARIIERNRVWHCVTGVYHDTWTLQDRVIRDNYFHANKFGLYELLGSNQPVGSGSAAFANGVVTVTTSFNHGLQEGELVAISSKCTGYAGKFYIFGVTAKAFQYTPLTAPTQSPCQVSITQIFTSRRMVIEGNVIEYTPRLVGGVDHSPPVGINLVTTGYTMQNPGYHLLFNLLVRRNLIRPVGGVGAAPVSDRRKNPFGVRVDSADGVVLEGNVVNVPDVSSNSLNMTYSANIKTLNNSRSDGTLLRAQNMLLNSTQDLIGHFPDLADELEDALILQWMRR